MKKSHFYVDNDLPLFYYRKADCMPEKGIIKSLKRHTRKRVQ